jgi:3'-phosphoadenosine 5'-phosphosulfate sulfotransferase (PAPS reductase)/FAD synthetase
MADIRYIASVSGGKDSTALFLWCIEQFGADGFEAVFADTGHEHPVTLNYVRNLAQMAGGPAVNFVKADFTERLARRGLEPTGIPMLDLARWKKRFPSARAQFCTHELKLQPIKAWIEATDDGRDVVTLCGIRAGESKRRSTLPERQFDDFFGCDTWRPLIAWTEERVFAMLDKHGVPPNPLYTLGYRRVGCFPCIHARKGELALLPDWAWARLEAMEKRMAQECGRTYGDSEEMFSTFFAQDKTPTACLSTADQVRTWSKTGKGGLQLDMFPADEQDPPHCMAGWGSCE